MYNYVHLHYWSSGLVPPYTLTLVQMYFLLFLYMYLQEMYVSFPYVFTIPTFSGTCRDKQRIPRKVNITLVHCLLPVLPDIYH